jgi:Carboxypeptidase regulatory-like domain
MNGMVNVMRFRLIALVFLTILAGWEPVGAQSQTGMIFGKVTDATGALIPGVTVTLTAANLLQPLTAISSETGSYQFPKLEIGAYSVKFEQPGFKTAVFSDVQITVGFNAQINAQMAVSAIAATVEVTEATPIVDTEQVGTKQTFEIEQLQSIPSARDPWVILQRTAGIAMDRENIGGNQSGQQSSYVSRGASGASAKWSLDGVDITDMAALSSPSYYDFDAFQEMTINTGGVDVTQQTGGVGINLVTKSGSDRFRGSGRFLVTDQRVESQNITDAIRFQGGGAGNPIQDIKDYGIEAGGPIKKGRAWIWGSFGKQTIDVGVVGFFLPSANCQATKAALGTTPLTQSILSANPISAVNDCLNTDETLLQTSNLKAEIQLFKGNKLTIFNNFAKKVRNARNASDLNPIETTVKQAAIPTIYGIGKNWWTTGPNPTFKFSDQWVVNDRFLLDVQYGHIGNNFILDFHDPTLATVQPSFIISTTLNGRSAANSLNFRPANVLNFNANYFLPGKLGADHAFKFGGYWRDNYSLGSSHTGGNASDRFPTSAELANPNDCATLAVGCQVGLTRDGLSIYDLKNISLYAMDTVRKGRVTLQLGVRYDRNHDQALAASVSANPIVPTLLPAVSFAGADPKIIFNNFSPRLGFTYDLTGNGKTLVHANWAYYYGQVGNGGVASQLNPVGAVTLRYQWLDANHDGFVQHDEIYDSKGNSINSASFNPANFLALSGNWLPTSPGSPTTKNTVDPNLKNDTTAEVIVGMDHQVSRDFALGGSYIYRRYGNPGPGWTPQNTLDPTGNTVTGFVSTTGSDYSAVSYTPPASACPTVAGGAVQNAYCPTVTYYQPNAQLSGVTTLTNNPFYRTYNGIEVSARKRMASHWLMDSSFSFNNATVHYPVGSYQDPSNIVQRNGYQYDYLTSGSGLGNVYINSKWLFKLSGLYELPGRVNVSAFYNARQGYPYERFILSPSRANGAGTVNILLDNVGASRLPNYQNLDFHAERPMSLESVRIVPSIDLFNLFNSNTVQAIRGTQNATTANNIQAIVAPRVLRAGFRVSW